MWAPEVPEGWGVAREGATQKQTRKKWTFLTKLAIKGSDLKMDRATRGLLSGSVQTAALQILCREGEGWRGSHTKEGRVGKLCQGNMSQRLGEELQERH